MLRELFGKASFGFDHGRNENFCGFFCGLRVQVHRSQLYTKPNEQVFLLLGGDDGVNGSGNLLRILF